LLDVGFLVFRDVICVAGNLEGPNVNPTFPKNVLPQFCSVLLLGEWFWEWVIYPPPPQWATDMTEN